MIMHYYLLEDNIIQQLRIKRILPHCEVFGQPKQFLSVLMSDKQPKIILIDLEINHHNYTGLSIAQFIRSRDVISPIIIVTTHTELMATSYQYQISALDFINKFQAESIFKQRLVSAITTAEKQLAEHVIAKPDFIAIPNGRKSEKVDIHEVVYIASDVLRSHRLIVYSEKSQLSVRGTMQHIEQLHKDLMRVHAAYIVNRHKIASLNTKERTLTLTNQARVPLSKKYYKKLQAVMAQDKH